MGASAERPLLRTYKALPRSGVVVPNIKVIDPENVNAVTAAPAPPLTPPGVGQEQVSGDSTLRKMDSSLSDSQTAGMLTPRRPSKPPTPDVTPPRINSTHRPLLNSLAYLSSSSRADSFRTACESLSSDGDVETPVRSRTTSQGTKRNVQSSPSNGLNGFHSKVANAKESPPSGSQQLSETEYWTGIESFDGDWGTSQADGSPIPRADTRKPARDHDTSEKPGVDRDALDVRRLDASLKSEISLRDRVHDAHERTASPPMERFRDDIGWPSDGSHHVEDPDVRRLSGISNTSTVEAMIIDSPKRAQRTLRHTEKRSSLRSTSSPITRSERTSIASNSGLQHRLIHKAARIPEDRRSMSSDLTKTTTSAPQASVDIIPVVVIPERRSSLQSAPNSRVSSRPSSKPEAQRSSRRPPTAPVGSDAPRPHKRRTMSDSVSAKPQEKEARGRHCGGPVIPPRSSSLSAPTSRNNSRATSLTSESLQSHTLAMDQEMQKHREQQPVSPPRYNILGPKNNHDSLEPPNLQALQVGADDMSTLRPPSVPYTPGSIPSSSPGPVEIQEATTVSLFAHNNRSLLLVDPRMQSESSTLRALQRDLQDKRVNPHTPDMLLPAATISVESPLKDPRPPPIPPICKPLPPLPTQDDDARDRQESSGPLVRRWNSVRRTFGARPRSDSFNSMTRSLSVRSAKNRKAGVEMDSRLHPFWRPRGFWEDIPGSSPPKDSSPVRRDQDPKEALIVNNSLGLPQRRIIFDGPPALARRSPEMKRLFVDGMSSRGSLMDQGILRTASPLYQHRYRLLSRRTLWFRWMSLRNRLRRVHQRRDERKRLARKETIKQSIRGPAYMASSATNGVVAR